MYYIGAPKPRGPSIFVLRHQARQCASSKRKGGEALIRGAPNRRQDLGAANVWSKISWTPHPPFGCGPRYLGPPCSKKS